MSIVVSAEKKNGTLSLLQRRQHMDFPIPVVCVTCNKPLYGKWKAFLERVKAYRKQDGRSETDDLVYLTTTTTVTAEGRAMNELGLTLECCRRHFLTHPGV
jgi:DNA-directed RNA polymerase subunit N (RpoN/RPB10)